MLNIVIKNKREVDSKTVEKPIESRIANLAKAGGFTNIEKGDANRDYRKKLAKVEHLKDLSDDTFDIEEYNEALHTVMGAFKKIDNNIENEEKIFEMMSSYRQDVFHIIELCDLNEDEQLEAVSIMKHISNERRKAQNNLKLLNKIKRAQDSNRSKMSPAINQMKQTIKSNSNDEYRYLLRADMDLILGNKSQDQ